MEQKIKIQREIGNFSKEDRISRIAEQLAGEEVNSKKIRWQGEVQRMKAYRIPLNLIRFNPYNGRIVVLSKENGLQESPHQDPIESPDVQIQIIEFLWSVNKSRNDETQKSLVQGQMEPAVITKDGILVDGNRRASLILKNRIEGHDDKDYLEAIVLDIDYAAEGRRTLERLETSIQIGEDKKLDYGAIEKYIKVYQMVEEAGVDVDDVAKSFGEKPPVINKWLSIKNYMDEYLEEIGAEGKYSRLANMEESFIEFEKLWSGIKNGGRGVAPGVKVDTRSDKEKLKKAFFSVMRFSSNESNDKLKIEQKAYVRPFLMPDSNRSSKSFLGNADLVNEFLENYQNNVLPSIQAFDRTETIESLRDAHPGISTQELFKIRDERWCAAASELSSLVKRAINKTQSEKDGSKPIEYIVDAHAKLSKVLMMNENGSVNFIEPSTETKLEAIVANHEEIIKAMAKMTDFLKRRFT